MVANYDDVAAKIIRILDSSQNLSKYELLGLARSLRAMDASEHAFALEQSLIRSGNLEASGEISAIIADFLKN